MNKFTKIATEALDKINHVIAEGEGNKPDEVGARYVEVAGFLAEAVQTARLAGAREGIHLGAELVDDYNIVHWIPSPSEDGGTHMDPWEAAPTLRFQEKELDDAKLLKMLVKLQDKENSVPKETHPKDLVEAAIQEIQDFRSGKYTTEGKTEEQVIESIVRDMAMRLRRYTIIQMIEFASHKSRCARSARGSEYCTCGLGDLRVEAGLSEV